MINIRKYTKTDINNFTSEEMHNILISTTNANTCRLCLCSEETVSNMFDLYYEDRKLSDLLDFCTSIQVLEDDSFSHNICSSCIVQLITVYEFIQKCCSSDKFLKSDQHDMSISELDNYADTKEEIKSNIKNEYNTNEVGVIEINEPYSGNNDFTLNLKNIKYDHNYDTSTYLLITLNEEEKNNERKINTDNTLKVNKDSSCQDKELLNNHLGPCKLKKQISKKLQCKKCLRSFSRKYKLVHHKCKKANEKYKCEVCSTNFNLKWNLKRHQMIHSGEKLFICEICGKGFIQKVSLETHRRIHSGHKPYICNFCGSALARSQDLKLHLARHASVDEDDIDPENTENRIFTCKICQKTTSSIRALRLHKSINHGTKSYLCSICGKGFVAKQGLLSHTKTHTGDKPYSCEFCQKKFAYKATLKDHVLLHTGERPHICKVCQKGFVQHHHLVHHMRTHSGEKPYSCMFCNKSFALKANLTVHIRTHTGETPYTCNVCGAGFYDSSGLKKHRFRSDH